MRFRLDKNIFYLGGQIEMKYDDKISLTDIEKVYKINKQREIEYGPPWNGFEAQSLRYHEKCLEIVKNMIIKYYEIIELRDIELILPPSPP
jgi:hypothetical protein